MVRSPLDLISIEAELPIMVCHVKVHHALWIMSDAVAAANGTVSIRPSFFGDAISFNGTAPLNKLCG